MAFTTEQLSEIHHAIMQHISKVEIKVGAAEPATHYLDDCVFYDGHCFKVFPEATTWVEA